MLTRNRLHAGTWGALLFVGGSFLVAQPQRSQFGFPRPTDTGWPVIAYSTPLAAPKVALGQSVSFGRWSYDGIARNLVVGEVLLIATTTAIERIIRRPPRRRIGISSLLCLVTVCALVAALLRMYPEWYWPDLASEYELGIIADPPTFADYLSSESTVPKLSVPGLFLGICCVVWLPITAALAIIRLAVRLLQRLLAAYNMNRGTPRLS